MKFLLATDQASLAADLRAMLELLVERVVLEVVHEDGRLALQRLESTVPTLSFLPLEMRGMEAITVLRRLGPESASIRKDIHANYKPGSWGPKYADDLLAKSARAWHNVM